MKRLLLIGLLTFACAAQAQWKYFTQKDEMTDVVTKVAQLVSPTKFKFRFPYAGGTSGMLRIATNPHGYNVRFIISRGQLLENEGLTFRFDDGPAISVEANGAADGSHDFLSVIDNSELPNKELIQMILAAKRIRVQATFFNEGERVFEFSPEKRK